MLIGQDRAGKTSLKKSLIGLPFNPKESSTDGIEVDPSMFQLDVDEVKNWQPIDESKQGLLPGCSTDVAQMVVEKLCIPVSHNWEEEEGKENDGQLDGHDNKNEEELDDTDRENEDQDSIEQVCLWSAHICFLTVNDLIGSLFQINVSCLITPLYIIDTPHDNCSKILRNNKTDQNSLTVFLFFFTFLLG